MLLLSAVISAASAGSGGDWVSSAPLAAAAITWAVASVWLNGLALAGLTLGAAALLYVCLGSWALASVRAGDVAVDSPVSLAPLVSALAVAAVYRSQRDPAGWRRVQRLLYAATAVALLHYVWPWPSVGPAAQLAWLVHPLRVRALSWNLLSESIVIALSLSPTLLVAFAWHHARRCSEGGASLGRLLALYGSPTLLLPLVTRSLSGQSGELAELGLVIGETAAAVALLIGVTSSIVFAFETRGQRTRVSRRGLALAVGASFALTVAPWAFGREPTPPWRLGPPSPQADQLFGTALPAWNDSLRSRKPAAEAEQLVQSARAVSPSLVAPLEALIADAGRESTRPKTWSARVSDVNDASRRLELPYYVTPTQIEVRGAARWFRLDTYRIDSTRRFAASGRTIEVLAVRALKPERSPSAQLGLSRDGEARVLVLLDGVESYVEQLDALAQGESGRCMKKAAKSSALERAVVRCGRLLRDARAGGSLRNGVVNAVIRHELQHQLDAGSPPIAATLRRRAGALGLSVPPQINRELSAYLAELTASDASPHVTLARLLRLSLIDQKLVDGAAARLALEVLEAPFEELAALDAETLRQRAAHAWQREYGSELPQLSES